MSDLYVKCCERSDKRIILNSRHNTFFLLTWNSDYHTWSQMDDDIEYCPWCGILLDTNLIP